MPATLIDEPFGIACVFRDGSTAKFGPATSLRRLTIVRLPSIVPVV